MSFVTKEPTHAKGVKVWVSGHRVSENPDLSNAPGLLPPVNEEGGTGNLPFTGKPVGRDPDQSVTTPYTANERGRNGKVIGCGLQKSQP